MNVHPECRATPCSDDHKCRPPESVQISAGVAGPRLMGLGVRLKPGYPGGNTNAVGIGGADAPPVEDPLNSDWHQQLVGCVRYVVAARPYRCFACGEREGEAG